MENWRLVSRWFSVSCFFLRSCVGSFICVVCYFLQTTPDRTPRSGSILEPPSTTWFQRFALLHLSLEMRAAISRFAPISNHYDGKANFLEFLFVKRRPTYKILCPQRLGQSL